MMQRIFFIYFKKGEVVSDILMITTLVSYVVLRGREKSLLLKQILKKGRGGLLNVLGGANFLLLFYLTKFTKLD